ncbi:MAG: lipoyl(octanoyl) transferase LipB [Alistipes sp.]|jgi:lipoyl(octanoyl) transferase|nr:lipoyl(octanoyl) transferase LipB [Alistipes sp.]
MRPTVELLDWGTIDYAEALARQERLFERLVARAATAAADLATQNIGLQSKPSVLRHPRRWTEVPRWLRTEATQNEGGQGEEIEDKGFAGWIVVCEHPHVYTLGRSGRAENLLVSEAELRERGATLHRVGRGGDITYHGPGQLVVYPIVDLGRLGLGLRGYIEALEQAVIETAGAFGLRGVGRVEGKTGVWVRSERGERKICAIGVRASRGVVMHGLALNVAVEAAWFGLINPCGMAGCEVASLDSELGRRVDFEEVKRVLGERLAANLGVVVSG